LRRFQSACLIIEVSQIVLHEAGEPNALVDLFDSVPLPSEDLAEVDFLPVGCRPMDDRIAERVQTWMLYH
jgi:hypothetical protein